MAEPRPSIVLRVSVPADGTFRNVAGDLAAKISEYVGSEPHGASVAAKVIEMASRVAKASTEGNAVVLTFDTQKDALVIRAERGRAREELSCTFTTP